MTLLHMSPPAIRPTQSRAQQLIGPIAITLTLIILVTWTWGRLLDPIIDFGRELYVPWQLTQGKVLYRDINSFYGPLSPWFNAALFRLFSPTLLTLVLANCIILWLTAMMLYRILIAISSKLAAAIAVILFLAICGTGHLIASGNFNFITPYSHEATHGFALSIAGLYCFLQFSQTFKSRWVFAAGVALGLVFLTKPELFLADAIALIFGVITLAHAHGQIRQGPRLILALAVGALLPVLIAFIILCTMMPLSLALRGIEGSWIFLSNSDITRSQFYSFLMGFSAPRFRLLQASESLGWIMILLAPGILLSTAIAARNPGRRTILSLLGAAAVGLISFVSSQWELWSWMGNSLLILVPLLLITQAVQWIRERNPQAREERIMRITLILFASLLLLKLGLNPRFMDYGFVLSGPALVLLIIAGVEWLPKWLEKKRFSASGYRGAVLALLLGILYVNVGITAAQIAPKTHRVGDGPNAFFMDDRASAFVDTLHYLTSNTTPADTFTALPEGAILNFLSKRESPSAFVSFVPSDFAMFGESQLLASLTSHPPDEIVIVHRPTSEYGQRRFGPDYGSRIVQWISTNYEQAHLSGAIPLVSDQFGILTLRRRDQGHAPPH